MMARPLELLAPARDADVARAALLCGADAVYIGGPSHGARAAAANAIDDIAKVVELAHTYGARVYVTINTIIYDNELSAVERTIDALYRIGVDALIVQDMALLRMDIPPIELHASTQCDIRTPQKAAFLAEQGFAQLVLPREFSLEQIQAVRQVVPANVSLEAFVHGALCVSYSGDCHASCATFGRSANRGECAQMCRMAYDLTDAEGNVLQAKRHFLSLSDLNRLDRLADLANSGISSFKIEGRLKDAHYVMNVVNAYRRAIDEVIANNPDKYCRASFGTPHVPFTPDVYKAFNRGFTPYFLDGRPSATTKMANLSTPKWTGTLVGTVRKQLPDCIVAQLTEKLNNGDGLGYYTADGQFAGFRLNRIDGDRLYPASKVRLQPGTKLYRNRDAARDAQIESARPSRTIAIDMHLHKISDNHIALSLKAENGSAISIAMECMLSEARSLQLDPRRRTLTKLGDTPFEIKKYTDSLPESNFIPASALAQLRRDACDALIRAIRLNHKYNPRRPLSQQLDHSTLSFPETTLDYHANIANAKARQFYQDFGATVAQDAMEVTGDTKGKRVMTTRYCLRRELGACLRTPNGKNLPQKLFLVNDAARFALDFDCQNCQMFVNSTKN